MGFERVFDPSPILSDTLAPSFAGKVVEFALVYDSHAMAPSHPRLTYRQRDQDSNDLKFY